jgi:hypothetical protein
MTSPSARRLLRTGLWQRVQGTGLERFELLQDAGGWVLRGTILAHEKHGPAQEDYEILCDADLEIDADGLVVDYEGIWRRVSG